MNSEPTYVFFTWEEISYSRTGVIFAGINHYLAKPVLKIIALGTVLSMTKEVRMFIKRNKISNPVYIIGSPCGLLVLSVRLAAPKSKIVFDTGWPQVDGLISRENSFIPRIFKFFKMYVLDLLSFNFSNLIAVESHAQLKRVRKRFFVKENKLFVSYTGLNEVHLRTSFQKGNSSDFNTQIVLFRGKFNHEAGLEFLAEISWLIPDYINFIVICPNIPKDLIFSPTTKVISERISEAELVDYYSRAYLAIGQLGNSKRTEFTIPHKFFEAAYFKVPYLTQNTEGMRELIPENDYDLFCDFDDPMKIARVIIQYAHNRNVQKLSASLLAQNYQSRFSQEILSRDFDNHVKKFLKLKI